MKPDGLRRNARLRPAFSRLCRSVRSSPGWPRKKAS
jgi:hypothetical protein